MRYGMRFDEIHFIDKIINVSLECVQVEIDRNSGRSPITLNVSPETVYQFSPRFCPFCI